MAEKDENPDKSRDAETVEKELEEACIIKPLDGGYGWVVVFASFLANVVVDGVIFTAGEALLTLWTQDFGTTDTAAALTMSILSGSYLLVGPIASAFANMFGCRAVVAAGSIMAFFGFICSIAAPQIWFLYITFGLIGGVGFGLIYLPAIVIIPQYFAEKRSLATGLAVCGSGIGTTIFSTLNPYVMGMVDNNWRYFMIFLAVSSLLGLISAVIYRPIVASPTQIEKVTRLTEEVTAAHETVEPRSRLGSELSGKPKFNQSKPYSSTIELNAAHKHPAALSHHDLAEAVARESVQDLNRPLSKMDVFYSGSTTNLRKRSRTISVCSSSASHGATKAQTDAEAQHEKVHSNIYLSTAGLQTADAQAGEREPGLKENLVATLKTLLDTSLLYSPSFMILAVSGFLTLCCFYVPYNYIGKHLDKVEGITAAQKSIPISLLGIINIFARIGCGWIADRPQVDALVVSNAALIMAGIATCCVPFFTQFWHFIVFCVPFAIGVACFAALRSVICVELFGLEKLSNAFGILLTFMGVGAVIGTPLAAFVKDLTGNFDYSFYIMGTLMALSGAVCIPLRKMRDWEEKRITAKDANNHVELQKLTESA